MNALNPAQQIVSIVKEIDSATKAIQDSDTAKDVARKRAIAAAEDLLSTLKTPVEVIQQHAFSGPDRMCVRIAVTLRIFHILAQREGRPISATELAKATGAEELFIVRVMRVLVTSRFVTEAGEELYAANGITKAMTMPPIQAAATHTFDYAFQVFSKMPAYFAKHGYSCPTDPQNGPFQSVFSTPLGFFEYLERDSAAFKDFDTFMTASRAHRPVFAKWFPVQERLIDGASNDDNDVMMVDIGGGRGQDLRTFKEMYPSAPGRLILQDLGRTVAEANMSGGIEAMAHDFFKPQPVKGARTYFFHYIMHNWPDAYVLNILSQVRTAMKPGYSRLILNEYILPPTNCPQSPSWADFHMMADGAACERTEKQFRALLRDAGFKEEDGAEINFYLPPGGSIDGVVEAVLGSGGSVSDEGSQDSGELVKMPPVL